jgi:NADPH-dependent ferric siderophore reductase
MKRATVAANEALGGGLRLITLEGAALEHVDWAPGQKIQIAMGSAFRARTYTPVEWNRATGRVCILGYSNGAGPGSAWLREAAPGTSCDIFGPRGSIDVRSLGGSIAMFGDETSIGLGFALVQNHRGSAIVGGFEVGNVEECRNALSQLGLDEFALIARTADETHLDRFGARLAELAASSYSFVLTGRAGTVQGLRRILDQLAVPSNRIITKAFWAPGKTGLD